jgi:serine/threonine protein kinase
VYKAKRLEPPNSLLAVKKINMVSLTTGVNQDTIKALRKEIEVMKQLKSSRFVVKYFGSEIVGPDFCIYMEHMNKGSLKTVYDLSGPVGEEKLKSYAAQILKGLQYLHKNNVIHCDLKCANILVSEDTD